MTRTITAYFDTHSDAQAAADRLASAGISPAEVSIHDSTSSDRAGGTTGSGDNKGFWASLGDLFVPDEDRYTYEEGIRRGGSVLTVRAHEAEFDRVSDILEEAGSVDLDDRETQWRSEGWSGYEAGRTGTAAGSAGAGLTSPMGSMTSGTTERTLGGTTAAGTTGGLGAASYGRETTAYADEDAGLDYSEAGSMREGNHDGTIEVVEENLRVGKRDVSHGRVRVRSYVVEDAVNEDVNLRSERVEIERRPVDRAVSSTDNAFRDQTLELEETTEEAVISKEARVTEEIDLNRVAENRTETVSDTVRRTEVEIEDERRGRTDAGTLSLTDDEIARRRGV